MAEHDNELRNFNEGRPMPGSGMRRLFPIGIAAAILIVAAIIFSSAGPDRTRTAQNNNPSPNTTAAKQSAPPESGIPARTGDSAPAARQTPTRSNPAGTQ
jgi:hypothetical protein